MKHESVAGRALAAHVPFSETLRLDAELVRIARGASALRLAVGEALDALSSSGGHHELGFSSLEAYARERCERTGRWAADTRWLAKRLARLPHTRNELVSGTIGWSTAELLARHVTAESELDWLEKARNATVRELRALLTDGKATEEEDDDEPTCKLTVTATREDGWLFEGARKVAEAVVGPLSADRLLQNLLAEGYSTLLELVPNAEGSGLYELEELEDDVDDGLEAQAAWCAERRRWRNEAEELCEKRSSTAAVPDSREGGAIGFGCSATDTPEALDREIRRWCSELSERDLALGIIAESARKAELWRRLGFASEAQYARERVGVSLSSLKSKRYLAARAGRVPELATALATGRVGYEAAYLLSRVVTPATVEEWLCRAERRTVKHLREEVEAVELLIRMGLGPDQGPLDEQSLDALFELERAIVSGDWLEGRNGEAQADCAKSRRHDRGQMSGTLSAAARHGRGRVTFRWTVSEKTRRFFLALERVFVRVSRRVYRGPASFLRFLSENFCRIWLPALRNERLTEAGEEPEYFGVYRRDRFRCSSPVCTRSDVTPHHLVFRSRGGGDDEENVVSLCVWCHLHGVHEGRIAAEAPASNVRWRIGRCGTLRVDGRLRSVR